MKKAMGIIFMVLLLIPVVAFCEEKAKEADTAMGQGMMMQEKMMGPGAEKEKPCKQEKMGMMGMMMQKQMVATSDGGVAVLVGHKLLKYDKNLKLVNETELKMDFEGMKMMMQGMGEKCSCSSCSKCQNKIQEESESAKQAKEVPQQKQ